MNRPKEYSSQPCWNHELIAAEFHMAVCTSGPGNTTPYHCTITNNTRPGVEPVQQFGTQCGARVQPGLAGVEWPTNSPQITSSFPNNILNKRTDLHRDFSINLLVRLYTLYLPGKYYHRGLALPPVVNLNRFHIISNDCVDSNRYHHYISRCLFSLF